jgi:hypothetical protein
MINYPCSHGVIKYCLVCELKKENNMVKFTPENITELKENEIFVFGANERYVHGAGAAKQALKFGAIYGKGFLQGNTWALPTKDKNLNVLPLSSIKEHIKDLYNCAAENQHLVFLVTKVGCGLSNCSPKQIAPLFASFKYIPPNIIFPKEFAEIIFSKEYIESCEKKTIEPTEPFYGNEY